MIEWLMVNALQAVPLLSVLEDLVKQRSGGGTNAGLVPKGVRFIWTSREREEFTLISESIMSAARWVPVIGGCQSSKGAPLAAPFNMKHLPISKPDLPF